MKKADLEALLRRTLSDSMVDELLDKNTKDREALFIQLAGTLIEAFEEAGLVEAGPEPKKVAPC
jgi:hypothetical protein